MNALDLTTGDLIRALRPAVDRAVRRRAEDMARGIAADGRSARVDRRGEGAYVVIVSGNPEAEEDQP